MNETVDPATDSECDELRDKYAECYVVLSPSGGNKTLHLPPPQERRPGVSRPTPTLREQSSWL